MTNRDEARERLAQDLADDERAYPGRSFLLVPKDDLRALLSTEEVGGSDQPLPTATPKSAVGEQDWRGIESAPMDGRSVLVFCPRASDHGYERIRLTWRKDGKWQGANNTSWPPTHWMPLPAAPKP